MHTFIVRLCKHLFRSRVNPLPTNNHPCVNPHLYSDRFSGFDRCGWKVHGPERRLLYQNTYICVCIHVIYV